MKKVRIIVAGGRDFNDCDLLSTTLLGIIENLITTNILDKSLQLEFISGTCRGADILGEQFAESCGYKIKRFPANWEGFGKRAGYIRNGYMAKYASEADIGILVAFWDGSSRGTGHMINIAKRYGLDVKVIKY